MPHAEPTLRCSSRMRNGRALQREPPIQTGEPPAPELDSRIATPPRRHRYPPVICFACHRGSQPSTRTNLLAIVITPVFQIGVRHPFCIAVAGIGKAFGNLDAALDPLRATRPILVL